MLPQDGGGANIAEPFEPGWPAILAVRLPRIDHLYPGPPGFAV